LRQSRERVRGRARLWWMFTGFLGCGLQFAHLPKAARGNRLSEIPQFPARILAKVGKRGVCSAS
jgi:hypothetical protein